MSVVMRQEVERKIAEAVITDALAAGYSLNVHNGGDGPELPAPTTDKAAVLDAMFATDDESLQFYKDDKRVGWVWFVYGNSGWDVIADYTTKLEHVMGNAQKLSDHYAG